MLGAVRLHEMVLPELSKEPGTPQLPPEEPWQGQEQGQGEVRVCARPGGRVMVTVC